LGSWTVAYSSDEPVVSHTEFIIQDIPVDIHILFPEGSLVGPDSVEITIRGSSRKVAIVEDEIVLRETFHASEQLTISWQGWTHSEPVTPVPLWMSILPPLIAILMALIFKEVYSALFTGLLVGAVILSYYQGFSFFPAVINGLLSIADVYIIESLFDRDHLSIIVFSMMIGATVTLISYNGGMKGVVSILSTYARNSRSGQFVTWLLGMAIFFDDYANTLVVGNTMRPVTDRLKISREKLSYIVDSTAAPIAAIAFVTTWIGAELSYIQDGINTIGINMSAYDVFINSLAYSFYPVLALLFILVIIFSGRDFGPMLKAEVSAMKNGISKIHPGTNKDFAPGMEQRERWYNAVIPVLVIVGVTITGLVTSGLKKTEWDVAVSFTANLSNVIGHANSYQALLWGSLSGVVSAMGLTIGQRLMTLKESMESLIKGFKTMITAVLILVLAWAIALITKYMHTADFISGLLLDVNLAPHLVPSITFLLAAFVAFATGSSWGTMAILYPLIMPASWILAREYGLEHDESLLIFYNVVSTVLAGSVLGDHCSPISDTTILSSLASSCNHIEHVRTQLPYALLIGVTGNLFGTLPAAYGVPVYLLFPLNLLLLYLFVRMFGKRIDIIVKSANTTP